MRLVYRAGLALAIACGLAPACAFAQDCGALLPGAENALAGQAELSAESLIRLREIGGAASVWSPGPFALSPDRTKVAFVVRQADPQTNSYCEGLVVLDLRGGNAHVVDRGYWTVRDVLSPAVEGAAPVLPFISSTSVPIWSHDGRWIAYPKRERSGVIQIWRARPDGTAAEALTHAPVNVASFAWSADATRLVYASRPGVIAARAQAEVEGRRGYHYDERFHPNEAMRPIDFDVPVVYMSRDLDAREERGASEAEIAALDANAAASPLLPPAPSREATGSDGAVVTIRAADPDWAIPEIELSARMPDGRQVICDAPQCARPLGVWRIGDQIVFAHAEGAGNGEIAFYRWASAQGAPVRTWSTTDLLFGCQPIGRELLCAREGATRPRYLALVDPLSGRARTLFDPNPEAAGWRFGHVERLTWRNALGAETFGDLVLPPDRRAGERLPLVVVGYVSRGFLRGGTGDEYPIQLLAARGYAVLSFQAPNGPGMLAPARTFIDAEHTNITGYAYHRNVEASLMAAIDLLGARGVIDRARIGITGFSAGAVEAGWALIHDDIFAAAALSHGGYDRIGSPLYGYRNMDRFAAYGYPKLTDDRDDFWRNFSLRLNAGQITTPILMQIADQEMPGPLLVASAFRELGRPLDLYVFPDETHVKWQPAHRLAVYARNLDWFDFWLRGVEHPSAERDPEYRRWREMREHQCQRLTDEETPRYCRHAGVAEAATSH